MDELKKLCLSFGREKFQEKPFTCEIHLYDDGDYNIQIFNTNKEGERFGYICRNSLDFKKMKPYRMDCLSGKKEWLKKKQKK